MPTASLYAQLGTAIRSHIQKFMDFWLICDDPACRCRTRVLSIKPRQCPGTGCRGFLSFEVILIYLTDKSMGTRAF